MRICAQLCKIDVLHRSFLPSFSENHKKLQKKCFFFEIAKNGGGGLMKNTVNGIFESKKMNNSTLKIFETLRILNELFKLKKLSWASEIFTTSFLGDFATLVTPLHTDFQKKQNLAHLRVQPFSKKNHLFRYISNFSNGHKILFTRPFFKIKHIFRKWRLWAIQKLCITILDLTFLWQNNHALKKKCQLSRFVLAVLRLIWDDE